MMNAGRAACKAKSLLASILLERWTRTSAVLHHDEATDYDRLVTARGIREFVSRDWVAVREAKDDYWGERIARLGAIEAFRIAEELRRQVLSQHPRWPDPEDRRQDLDAHLRLAELLHRASPARRG